MNLPNRNPPNPSTNEPMNIQPEPTARLTAKKNPLPLVAGAAGVALLAFLLGRGTTPPATTTVNTDTTETTVVESEAPSGGVQLITFDGDAAQTAGVQIAPVALSPAAGGIPFNGEVEASPNRVVRVSSVVPGRITRLLVSLGDRVRQGQTLAIVESRAIGEAQSAYQQAVARFGNAQSNLNVVTRQARAGVFARAPLEAARRAQVEAQGDVREQETAVRQARVALDNILRQARIGSFASPALEAARSQKSRADEALRIALAAAGQARARVASAESELRRRRELASSGAYVSRPVEEARRVLVAAQSARNAAQSEVATTRANLARAKSLLAEGLMSQRDQEASQQAFDTATARLETAQSDERTGQQELERQQKLATSNVAGTAEVGAAQSAVEGARGDVETRAAEAARAREGVKLADVALSRERAVFRQNIANRREVSAAQSTLETAQNALVKARQTLSVVNAAYERERSISRQNLNNVAQVQTAQSTFNAARADLQASRTALSLLKSAPGGRASIPIVAPLGGVVQERPAAQGEVITADTNLMTIADLSIVRIAMFLPEREIGRVRLGAPITATMDALSGRTFTGDIELIQAQVNPKTRTVEAHAEIPNPGDIKPGMFARGRIHTGAGNLQISVPAEAVQDMDGKKVVFVPSGKPNTFEVREVQAEAPEGGRTVIKNGLKPSERIVTKGAFMVKAQSMKSELAEE